MAAPDGDTNATVLFPPMRFDESVGARGMAKRRPGGASTDADSLGLRSRPRHRCGRRQRYGKPSTNRNMRASSMPRSLPKMSVKSFSRCGPS
jgi:hypothetical protein